MSTMTAEGYIPMDVSLISEEHALAFLEATNPCFALLPSEFREVVREYLQREAASGAITETDLAEHARIAHENKPFRD